MGGGVHRLTILVLSARLHLLRLLFPYITTMRYFVFLPALALLVIGTFNITAAQDTAVPKDVQELIDRIKRLNGQYTLTPENTFKTITFTNGSQLTAEMIELFGKQTDLETLQIASYRELNDAAVAKLTNLKKLKILGLTNSVISDAAVKTITESFPNLVNLDVSSNARLTDAAAKDIAKLEKLEVLGLLQCNISELGIAYIAILEKLRALDIRGCQIGDGGLEELAEIPTLRSLKHRNTTVSDEGIKALIEAKALDSFLLQDFEITGKSGQHLRKMEKLTSLEIFRCSKFDSSGVLALKGMKLNRLTLRGLPIDDTAMDAFKELQTIKRLYLQELPSVTDAGVANIAVLKDLETLDVWEVPITDKSVEIIAKFAAMKELLLRGTKITDKGLELLLTMPKLEKVTLTDNVNVTPAMIQKLRDAKKFEVLPKQN